MFFAVLKNLIILFIGSFKAVIFVQTDLGGSVLNSPV